MKTFVFTYMPYSTQKFSDLSYENFMYIIKAFVLLIKLQKFSPLKCVIMYTLMVTLY